MDPNTALFDGQKVRSMIHERVGILEQYRHTHEHRITHLEQLPHRVSSLESDFAAIKSDQRAILADQAATKDHLKVVSESIQKLKVSQSTDAASIRTTVKIASAIPSIIGCLYVIYQWMKVSG